MRFTVFAFFHRLTVFSKCIIFLLLNSPIFRRGYNIKLPEEHGGCWNVQHFADEQVKFSLQKQSAWTQIRFITTDKAWFYSDMSIDKKQKTYVVKNDFVCIDKIERDWAYCTYYGKTITKGWIRIADLNKM